MSNKLTDPAYLKAQQYNNADKLSARIRLHQDFSTNQQPIFRWLWDTVLPEAPTEAQILEVGAGRGDMWSQNEDRIPEGWTITLTDFSSGMLENNRAFLGELANRMTYETVDVQKLPYSSEQFDIVFANMMLYHIPDLDRALAEIRRVLKPDGVLVAMTNGNNHMREVYTLVTGVDPTLEAPEIFARTFSMQNGAARLEPHFAAVRAEHYDCDLHVTEAQPLLDYMASMMTVPGESLYNEKEKELRREIARQIAAHGKVLIRKETGAFIAAGVK